MRSVMLCNTTLWLIYDLSLSAYANMITHGLTLFSLITAKIRLDRTPSEPKEKPQDNQGEA